KDADRTFCEITGPSVREWQPNQGVFEDVPEGIEGIVRKLSGDAATIELTRDYRNERHNVWGVTARNREQNFALNLLMDPEIDFVTVLGPAGTGKTLLALAAGLTQTLETNRFVEIIMTRVTIPLGEDIGFLPGTELACLGNIAQIDTPYLTEMTSGLTYAVNRFRGWAHSGHVTLVRGERSRLADFASDIL